MIPPSYLGTFDIQIPNLMCALFLDNSKKVRLIILERSGTPFSISNTLLSGYQYIDRLMINSRYPTTLYGDNIIVVRSISKGFKITNFKTRKEVPYQIINNKDLVNATLDDIKINNQSLHYYITTFQVMDDNVEYDFS